MLLGSLLFVLGFAIVFVLIGAAFGSVGVWLRSWQDEITVVLGSALILLGLVFAGVVPWLQRDWRIHKIPAVGLAAAPLIGALFAIGWTPCIGPTYGVIFNLTYVDATAARGALLSFFYALGLGIPFIVAGLAYRRTLGAVAWVRRHQVWVMRIGGAFLVMVGSPWSPDGGTTWCSGCSSGWSTTGRPRCERPRPAPRRAGRADRPRAGAVDLAPGHVDADGAGPAAPARTRGHPGVGHPAVGRRRARGHPVEERASRPDADLREARPVLGLRLDLVLRDLPAAGAVPGRLHRAATGRLRPGVACPAAEGAAQPLPPPGPRVLRDDAVCRRGARPGARGPRQALPAAPRRGRARPTPSAPSAATCARPATCSSTCRC